MRIHRIELRNFRGIAHQQVVLDPRGVTIVEGDNEVGKTSVADAMALVFEEPDSSKKARIRSVKPVDSDVGPEVTVEVAVAGHQFTYTKRWLRRPSTTLTVSSPRREQLTGREAHNRAHAILAESLDWSLWRALRLEQGGPPSSTCFAVPSLGQALDLAVGSTPAGDGEDALWDRIAAERDRYWTATGKPRVELTSLAEQLAGAWDQAAAAGEAIRSLDDQTTDLEALSAQGRELADRQDGLDRAAAELHARTVVVDGLRDRVRSRATAEAAARAEECRCTTVAARRVGLIEREAASVAALAAAEGALADIAPAQAEAEALLLAGRRAHQEAGEALRLVEGRHTVAVADSDHLRRQIEVELFGERRARVVSEGAALVEAQAVVDGSDVDEAVVASIEEAHLELVRAEAAAAAGAATVTIRGLTDAVVEVDGRPVEVPNGEAVDVTLESSVELVFPGLAALAVRAGAEEQARAERVSAAQAELHRRCRSAEVVDLDEARSVAAERALAIATAQRAADRIRADLRDLTLEALDQKIERLTMKIAAHAAARAGGPPLPADHDAAQSAARSAEADLVAARADALEAAQRLTLAEQGVSASKVAEAGVSERARLAEASLAQDRAVLEAERAEEGDEAVAADLAAANSAQTVASASLSEAEAALAGQDPDTLESLAANAREAAERGAEAILANQGEQAQVQTRLETVGEQGLAAEQDAATTEAEHLARQLAALEARAAAARRLHDAFAARRDDARSRYVAPFRQQIERFGRLVFGDTLEVELGPDLQIVQRTLAGTTVAWDQLSTGAREQLGLIARLACASIVSADGGGAPVVFDDALGWTDPARLPKMAAAIALAGRECQIVILTCTPGRYAGIGTATTVRLHGGARRGQLSAVSGPGTKASAGVGRASR